MMRPLPLCATIFLSFQLTSPLLAQTAGDDLPSAETWWDSVGAQFFSDDGLMTQRPDAEIRAHWTGLSEDDQRAVLARCAALKGEGSGQSVSEQEGSNTGLGGVNDLEKAIDNENETATDDSPAVGQRTDTEANSSSSDTNAQTSITGTSGGNEIQQSADGTVGDTGLAGGTTDPRSLEPVCRLIENL